MAATIVTSVAGDTLDGIISRNYGVVGRALRAAVRAASGGLAAAGVLPIGTRIELPDIDAIAEATGLLVSAQGDTLSGIIDRHYGALGAGLRAAVLSAVGAANGGGLGAAENTIPAGTPLELPELGPIAEAAGLLADAVEQDLSPVPAAGGERPAQMQVGSFRFEAAAGRAEYSELMRRRERRWAGRERHGRPAQLEDLGRAAETLDLRGTIYVRTAADLAALDDLRREAGLPGDDGARPQPLGVFRGGDDTHSGEYLGQWVVVRVVERERDLRLGGAPTRISFEISLLEHVQ